MELPSAVRDAARASGIDGDRVLLEATRIAGRLNGCTIVPPLADNPAYHAKSNAKEPRRIDSVLELYDCINCDLCIAACPNDAIFAYEVQPISVPIERLAASQGEELTRTPGEGFTILEHHQLAVYEAGCNECSNCEVYCPEDGAPFVVKERFFLDRDTFAASHEDGFCREGDMLHARLGGIEMRFVPDPGDNQATVTSNDFRLVLSWEPFEVTRGHITGGSVGIDTAALWRLRTVWDSVFCSDKPSMPLPDPS